MFPEYKPGNDLDKRRGHKLLPPSGVKLLPQPFRGEADAVNDQTMIPVKFFATGSSWTWYAVDYDPEQRIFFGLVDGLEVELGDFSLDELASMVYPDGFMEGHPRVERALYWQPITLAKLRERLSRLHGDWGNDPGPAE